MLFIENISFYYCPFNKMIGQYKETQTLQSQTQPDSVSQIIYNENFRLLLRQTVDDMCRKSMEQEEQDYKPLGEVVSEIVEYLFVYINDSILKYNNEYSQTLLKKFQQLYLDHENRMRRKMEEKFTEILEQLLQRIENISVPLGTSTIQIEHQRMKRIEEVSEKRKTITNKIINSSILAEVSQEKEGLGDDDSLSGFEGILDDEFSLLATKKFEELSNRINEVDATIKEGKGQFFKKLKKIEDTMKNMTQQISYIKKNVQDHLQLNLEGVWNVVAELQKKILSMNPTEDE